MLKSMPSPPIDPPSRLLCGPGPSTVDPRVLAAMQRPMLGHLDPDFHDLLEEVVRMLRLVYRAPEGLALPLSATGTSGMEVGIVNLLAPGETIIVGQCGFFGRRIVEVARRHGADVIVVEADWGEAVPNAALLQALDEHPETRILAVVHAETSTGVEHPLAALGKELRAHPGGENVLLMADCVTSLGGVELEFERWGVDYAYSCTQKCLAAPPGMSPIALSERALERIEARDHAVPFSLDIELLRNYWTERPAVYHHTVPVLHIYALHEALRLVLAEGLERRWNRHRVAGAYLQQGLYALGFSLLATPTRQLAPLTAVRVPDDVDGKQVQEQLLRDHGIEVGGGLGSLAPPMWRIGLMGPNANQETADAVLTAFEEVFSQQPVLAAMAAG
jgi:alanine-glyoxylate transaminase / serine-glyoxylate transaminase / serine-pyruvate transaminase